MSSIERGVLWAAVVLPLSTAAFLLFRVTEWPLTPLQREMVPLGLCFPLYLAVAALFDPKWRGEPGGVRQVLHAHGALALLLSVTAVVLDRWSWTVAFAFAANVGFLVLLVAVSKNQRVVYRLAHILSGIAAVAVLRFTIGNMYADPLLATMLAPMFFVLPFLAAFGTVVREEPPAEDRWARVRSELERYGKTQRERTAGQLSVSATGDGKLSEPSAEPGALSEP